MHHSVVLFKSCFNPSTKFHRSFCCYFLIPRKLVNTFLVVDDPHPTFTHLINKIELQQKINMLDVYPLPSLLHVW